MEDGDADVAIWVDCRCGRIRRCYKAERDLLSDGGLRGIQEGEGERTVWVEDGCLKGHFRREMRVFRWEFEMCSEETPYIRVICVSLGPLASHVHE